MDALKMLLVSLVSVSVVALPLAQAAESAREWKTADGSRTLLAEYVGSRDGKVTIRRNQDGKTFTIGLDTLSEEDRETVTKLGAILRFADGLDRSHTDAVTDLDCEILGRHVIVTLYPPYGNEIERWAGLKKSRFFQEVFGVTVELR